MKEYVKADLRTKYPKEVFEEIDRLGEECWELTKDGISFTMKELKENPEKEVEITFKDGTKKIVKLKDMPCFKVLITP